MRKHKRSLHVPHEFALALALYAFTVEKIQDGRTYAIRNIKSGTVVEVAKDNKSSASFLVSNRLGEVVQHRHVELTMFVIIVVGNVLNSAPNQKWTTNWTGKGWTLRSVASGQYLSIAGPPANGTKLVLSAAAFEWHIWHDEVYPGVYRIFVPYTTQNLDLYNYGDFAPGTPVTLWNRWEGAHQLWDFDPVQWVVSKGR
ncbi:hypothetical protein CC1G_07937 [Coprinopsis cinerea okayama7|uniref:Ricin B lectin domain-containing protein n=1 Tax=Coprinopsis cinerea (strain Okayama-7 / 130 / ATCC MYA-4618 / FGSC 9003) TaxID=240176 RepID=A8P1Y0_COPC7|nr:hypothetical protein CC1G_07937 [Coprinopsis cinerea okayama7\|eukprot:XP_001838196.2 hypothetical protein CC1G_07937 [Coprinopsis cinerea okayama7\